jgi:hypothetical protein
MESEREDLIRRRAYAIWESEGRPEGKGDDHWRRASSEMHGLEDVINEAKSPPVVTAPAGRKAGSAARKPGT